MSTTRTPFVPTASFQALLLREADTLPPEMIAVLRDHWTPLLLHEGLIDAVIDPERRARSIDHWTLQAFRVVRRLASHPFETQAALARDFDISADVLVRLNRVLRGSDLAQQLMLQHGHAAKYWQNTIMPIVRAGALRAVRRHETRHPFRVGVYPGVSCMFSCSFCGRHRDARYTPDHLATGNVLLDAMMRAAPTDDPYAFYISGGLEPLTNPGLGALVSAGAARGFKLSLYTNGYMLTPQLLNRQPGLWELDSLRISLYGPDQASAARVTGNDKAFAQVRCNAARYLRMRNERDAATKLGFNFVLLHGHADQVLEIVELIAEVNREAGGGRQVDFLTLREDYSVTPDRGLSIDERIRMIDVFAALEERCRRDDLGGLHIDYGYALHPESQGVAGRPLEMARHTDMRPHGFPQISVVVDLLGDVYLYREAGFLDRPGARRYIIGRVTATRSLEEVVREFVESRQGIEPVDGDTAYFDIFDHVVTQLLNQTDADERFGVPFEQGPIRDRLS